MKNFKLAIMCIAMMAAAYSCTPEDQQTNEYQTDKDKVCPPNDRNCNGIPDDQE